MKQASHCKCCNAGTVASARAYVFVVHEEPRFVDQVTAELSLAGYEIVAFTGPVLAMYALGKADRVGEGRRFDLGIVMGASLCTVRR